MEKLRDIFKQDPGLCIIIAAAVLFEVVSVIMFYISHNIIQQTMEQLVEHEMCGEVFAKLRIIQYCLPIVLVLSMLVLGYIVYRTSRSMERLRQTNAEKERISSELLVASQIQQSMLPDSYLKQDGLEVFGSLVPAREVGGDLFDYFIRDEKLFFCIGDVCGKGTPAAMLMSSVRSLLHAFSIHESNPARILQTVNDAASQGNDSCMFVTLFIGVLDLPTGRLHYSNAGHNVPYILGSELTQLDCEANVPIGPFDDAVFNVQTIQLHSGDTIFLYTDGLTEANNIESQELGVERAEEVLRSCAEQKLNPEAIVATVTDAVHRFAGEALQSDDLTMMAIRYTPQQFESTLSETITIKNDMSEVPRLGSFQSKVYQQMNIEPSLAGKLRLAVEEAVVNVIEYAYPAGRVGDIEVRLLSDGRLLKVMILDSGIAFDPTTIAKADTTLAANERRTGGLGMLLVRELMSSVNYERIDGKNILTLNKLIG